MEIIGYLLISIVGGSIAWAISPTLGVIAYIAATIGLFRKISTYGRLAKEKYVVGDSKLNSRMASVSISYGGSSIDEYDSQDVRYFGKNANLQVGGFEITDPMVYVGKKTGSNGSKFPHVIYQNLSVGKSLTSEDIGYWPSYSQITQNNRYTFLNWLANGKKSQSINIGYVFIYFYGLEFRAIYEKRDKKEILNEVIRLHNIYNTNGSFRGYAENFIAWLILSMDDFSDDEIVSLMDFLNKAQPYSLIHTYGVKFHLLKNHKFSLEDLFEMIPTFEAVPRSKIPEKVGKLFKTYVLETISSSSPEILNEIQVKESQCHYHCASSLYELRSKAYTKGYSISLAKRHQNKIAKIWEKCIEEFRPYSRKVGKVNEEELYQLLPNSLKAHHRHPLHEAINSFLSDSQKKSLKIGSLIQGIGGSYKEKFTLKESKDLCNTLQQTGFNIEPDSRYTGKSYKWDDYIVAFKDGVSQLQGSNYSTAAMLFDLGVSISSSDNQIDDSELNLVENFVSENICESESEKKRISYRKILARDGFINGRGIAKKLSERLKVKELEPVGRFLFAIASADGAVAKSELSAIKRTFKDLGLPEAYFQSLSDEFVVEKVPSTPVTIREAKGRVATGSFIPRPDAEDKENSINLNLERLEKLRNNTQEIKSILAETFQDEPEDEDPIPVPSSLPPEDPSTLPADLSEFYQTLISREIWEKKELRELAVQKGIMLGDAIDRINNWADEHLGDYLIYENESFQVQRELIDKGVSQ